MNYFVRKNIKIKDVAAGGKHTLFVTGKYFILKAANSVFASFRIYGLIYIHDIESGQVYAAGMNDFGQLGLGPDAARIQKNIEPREIH